MHKRLLTILLIIVFSILEIVPTNAQKGKVLKIKLSDLKDKIAAAWIGEMVGNMYGLPHENKYILSPGLEKWPYGYSKSLDKLKKYDGAFSDDDTDVEYMYLLSMEKYGSEPTYEQLRDDWLYHIRDRVWLANRGALGLMHFGFTPPYTGNKEINPHWYQIDPQLINEIWAYTAPGMVKYAAAKSEWAGRITSDDWGIEPTIHYGAMYAAAFFENDIRKLIEIGLKELPQQGRYAQTVRDMIALHDKYPNSWQDARAEMAKKYYIDEPDMTKTIWNANLNGACAILAMLYGNGDFQRTLDLSCAMGFDADNQAATVAGLMGVIYGMKGIPSKLYLPIEGWKVPFNDRYINITRYDLPDASIKDIIDRTVKQCIKLVESKGGKLSGEKGKEVLSINSGALYNPPIEFSIGPAPRMEIGKVVDYYFSTPNNRNYTWQMVSGTLPEGLTFDKGHLLGTPNKPGYYSVTLQIDNGITSIKHDFQLLVRNTNIALKADSILANVRTLNEAVLDSCWYTFGKSLYAKNVNVINDGKIYGPGSVFYSIAAKAKIHKVDYYGYLWKEDQNIEMIAFHTGGMEEFGGWFTSLNVQYQDSNGKWKPVEKINIQPSLPETDVVFYQPHFVEYVITFDPVKTKAIRIIGDAMVQSHWNKYTKNVSAFTSITELSVYQTINQ
ncbi:MAG: ADP-ribosylglycohydrolase family protein [Bacteroidales bacterium]|jgi:hypothetical protein|nr:ADP-ribosylglycohydrolase family protein [Bacteroidales bacterium]HOD61619.1 ADP-ribosylglycohydrolase family protein [Bacilli bacterium]